MEAGSCCVNAKRGCFGEKVAIKILEKEKIKDDSDKERVSRELKILRMIRHPNIIQLYEVELAKESHHKSAKETLW